MNKWLRFAGVYVIRLSICKGIAFGAPPSTVSEEELASPVMRAVFHPAARAWIEANVHVGRPAAKVMGWECFGLPACTATVPLGDGLAALTGALTKDVVFETAEVALQSPAVMCEQLADEMMRSGLEAYRESYRLHLDWRSGGEMSADDRAAFARAAPLVNLLVLGKELWSDVHQEKFAVGESAQASSSVKKTAGVALAALAQLRGLSDAWDLATTIVRVRGVLADAESPLTDYPPYRNHLARLAALDADVRASLDGILDLSTDEVGASGEKPDLHYLVVDRSGSMKDNQLLQPVIDAVSAYLDVLPTRAELRIVFFNTAPGGAGCWKPLTGRNRVLFHDHFIREFAPGGNTRLYDTVAEVIGEVTAETNAYGSIRVMILSDGEDNASVLHKGWSGIEAMAGNLKRDKRDAFIQWFTLGFKPAEVPDANIIEVVDVPVPAHGFNLDAAPNDHAAYMRLAEAVYRDWLDAFGEASSPEIEHLIADGWEQLVPVEHAHGFAAGVYRHKPTGKTVFAFRGTDGVQDWIQNVRHVLWMSAQQFGKAGEYARAAIRAYGDDVVFVGHSLGGGLAQYAAMETGAEAVTVNPLALTYRDVIAQFAHGNSLGNGARITNYIHRNDILNYYITGAFLESSEGGVVRWARKEDGVLLFATSLVVGKVVYVGERTAMCDAFSAALMPRACSIADFNQMTADHSVASVLKALEP